MRTLACLAACSLAACVTLHAEETAVKSHPTSPSEFINQHLPSWIRLTGELRAREEGFLSGKFVEGNDDVYLLQRVRLGLEIRPVAWLGFYVQGQDSRVSFTDRVSAAPPLQDSADLRQAYVRFGSREARGVDLTLGRQELAFGEERLVGAGNWGNVARTFDGVRLGLHRGSTRFDIFASSVVVARDHQFDRHLEGDNLHGIYGQIGGLIPKATIEPFVFWRLSPLVSSERGLRGHLDTKTTGVRWAGQLPHKSDYTIEVAAQTGSWGSDTMRAWAAFGRLRHELADLPFHPRLSLELNHASGDRDPNDGRHGTFDVLYPTPHEKYGLADQVGWKNVNHIAFIAEIKPRSALTLQAKAHDWWLASARDGLYNAAGSLLARDIAGRSGRHIGEELDVQALWSVNKHFGIAGGIGHIFAGEYLKNTTPGGAFTFPYLQFTCGL